MAESLHEVASVEASAPTDRRPRLVIVSDVLLYRQGLEASIGKDGRVEVVGATSTKEALRALSTYMPDVVLLDGAANECLALARTVRTELPMIRLVGFGISGGAERLVDCAQSGLAAFVDSNASATDLASAALAVLKGELACSPQVSALLCERLAHYATVGQEPDALTRREREIAVLIGDGLSNKEIAQDLKIGPSTVKNHVHNILEKLRVRRRSAIAHQLGAFRWGMSATQQISAE